MLCVGGRDKRPTIVKKKKLESGVVSTGFVAARSAYIKRPRSEAARQDNTHRTAINPLILAALRARARARAPEDEPRAAGRGRARGHATLFTVPRGLVGRTRLGSRTVLCVSGSSGFSPRDESVFFFCFALFSIWGGSLRGFSILG